jgi:hypothetical protein
MNIGWSTSARKRNRPGTGHSYTVLSDRNLLRAIEWGWHYRKPGDGEKGLDRKILVPVDSVVTSAFYCPVYKVDVDTQLDVRVSKRQDHEDLKIDVFLKQPKWWQFWRKPVLPEPARFVDVVLYSRETLLENNGEVSGDYDWEIVALLARSVEKEPMNPLTMARNMLEHSGGTKSTYTAQEFAESIYYWSQRVKG